MKAIYSFDLDGTLCVNHCRTELLSVMTEMRGPIEKWDPVAITQVMSSVLDDKPTPLIEIVRGLSHCHIVSARPGSCVNHTHQWLKRHHISRYDLHMREDPSDWSVNGRVWKGQKLHELVGDLGPEYELVHFDDDRGLASEVSSRRVHLVLCPWNQHV